MADIKICDICKQRVRIINKVSIKYEKIVYNYNYSMLKYVNDKKSRFELCDKCFKKMFNEEIIKLIN